MTVLTEFSDLPERIAASAARVRELTEAVDAERRQRNELIVQAIDDAGMSQAAVARAASLAQPVVVRILAAADND